MTAHSYQVNNLFQSLLIIPLCYVTILSASTAWKWVNLYLSISNLFPDYDNHIIEVITFCYEAKLGK